MVNNTLTFPVEEIFQDIDGDPDNVIMNIPEQIMQQMGWKEGDTLKIEASEEGFLSITKVSNAKE
jgi:hypothetical protein